MRSPDDQTLQISARAAAWLARLRSEQHTVEDERALHAWLAANPAHVAAFETINAVWDAAAPVHYDLRRKQVALARRVSRRAVFGGVAAAAGLAGATFVAMKAAQADIYRTEIGEQKHVRLRDGSELFLDTDSKLTVALDRNSRKAALEYGCANFRLASDPSRPFGVNVAQYMVVGDHSTFDVKRDGSIASIVMLQGQASVESRQSDAGPARVLNNGERFVAVQGSAKIDKPDLLPLTAWHIGQAIFRDETLVAAASEMNRYSTLRIEISDPRIQGLKVSGVYRVGDNMMFALALAELLPVLVLPSDDKIQIIGDDKRLRQI